MAGIPEASGRSATVGRWLCAALLLAAAAWAILVTPEADFVQNYAAARGWMLGLDPNGGTRALLAACCPDAPHTMIPQTAHPPLATLLALPFALLPWAPARWLWMLCGWLLVALTWHRLRTPPLLCLLTASFWVIGLALGALEPALFALVGLGLLLLDRAPLRGGALLGLAVALKTYPGVLLIGLLLGRRWRALAAVAGAALAATLLAELVIGPGATRDWLAFSQLNAQAQMAQARNISLVRLVHTALPGVAPTLVALLLCALLALPLARRLAGGAGPAALIPVMLLASPITWEQYFVALALVPLRRAEQALLAVGGAVIVLVWLGLLPGDGLAPLAYGPLLAAALLVWYRQARPAPAAAPEEQPADREHPPAQRV